MIYFDNAATTLPKPPAVAEAVTEALAVCGNPGRGAHGASVHALRILLEAREAAADLFGISDPARVAFFPNATWALNTAVGGLTGGLLVTAADHNSVLRPAFRRGDCRVVPVDIRGRLDLDQLESMLTPEVGALVMPHASNVTGNVYDIEAVGALCRDRGVRLVVDAAQTAGLLPIRMEAWGISALAFTGHKSLYGPTGTGGLCLAPDFRPPGLAVGGSGSDSYARTHPDGMPDALEAGTANVHGIAGLLAGIRYGRELEGTAYTGAMALADRFVRAAGEIPGIRLYGDFTGLRIPVVASNLPGTDAARTAFLLGEGGVAVRAGAHCAPLMHRALGTEPCGAVRFSFSHLNTAEEVDRAVELLRSIVEERGREQNG